MESSTNKIAKGHLLRRNTYRIETQIGRGGFGITYLGYNQLLNIPVVIKELFLSDYCKRENGHTVSIQSITEEKFSFFKEKFIQEGRTLAQFNHPNIVKVKDIFEENNTVYLVMEYIQGTTLKTYVENKKELPIKEIFGLIKQVGAALIEVHQKGFLHRDVKPSNIMVQPNGNVILIDFGIAKAISDGVIYKNTKIYSPNYSPLEQRTRKGKTGSWTDVYGLAATTFYCLAGVPPTDALDISQGEELDFKGNGVVLKEIIQKGMALKVEERSQGIDIFITNLTDKIKEKFGVKSIVEIDKAKQNHENIGYAIMGTPNGIQSINRGIIENQRIAHIVDLDSGGMRLFPDSEIFGVIKQIEGPNIYIYYMLYRYALEIDRERTGGFYGSVVVLKNMHAESAFIYAVLIELAANVRGYTRKDGKFLTSLDKIDFREPTSLGLLNQSLRPFEHTFTINSDKAFFDISQGGNVISFFEAMLDRHNYLNLESGFVSVNPQVLRSVGIEDLYPIVKLNDDDNHWTIQTLENKNRQLENELEGTKSVMALLKQEVEESNLNLKAENDNLRQELRYTKDKIVATSNQLLQKEKEHTSILEAKVNQLEGELEEAKSNMILINEKENKEKNQSLSLEKESITKDETINNLKTQDTTNDNQIGITSISEGYYSNWLIKRERIIKIIMMALLIMLSSIMVYLLFKQIGLNLFSNSTSPQNNNKSYLQQIENNPQIDINANTLVVDTIKKDDAEDNLENLKKQARDLTQEIINQEYNYSEQLTSGLLIEMKSKGLENTSEYKILIKAYQNWRNTGYARYQLKLIDVKPIEGRGLDAIAESIIDKNPYLRNCHGRESIKQELKTFNKSDISEDGLIRTNNILILWIPSQKYCN